MIDAIIELNDIDLPVWHAGNVHHVPAFALLQKDGLQFGSAARAQARLFPLKINNRFLQMLSMVETPELHPYARHQADLAYRFFNYVHGETGKPGRCVFVVPPNYSEDQLGVLLGVAAQCPFDAIGLVDQAVVAAAATGNQDHGVFCDIQLHQLVLCEYRREGDQLVRGASRSVNQIGLLALHDQWVRIIADAFVQQCRFDPLHDAIVEQQLWAELPELLSASAGQDVIQYGLLNKHQVRIPKADIERPINEFRDRLQKEAEALAPAATEWIWSSRLASIPGLDASDPRIKRVEPGGMTDTVLREQALICSDQATLPFVTSLPYVAAQGIASQSTRGVAGKPAHTSALTHFVLDGTASVLDEHGLYLNSLGGGIVWSRQAGSLASARVFFADACWRIEATGNEPVWHNDTALNAPAILCKGDQVRLSSQGASVLFIELGE